MPNGIDENLADWKSRMKLKTEAVILQTAKGNLKAAFWAENEAKKRAMTLIYDTPTPKGGKRTGLYKASIGSGMHPDKEHTAIIFATVPYAKWLEFGTSRNPKALFILTDAVVKNRVIIKKIIADHIKAVTKR